MDYVSLLKDKGLKVTKGRRAILQILFESNKELTAEDILYMCKNNEIFINQSTVYRALDLFCEKEIIDKFPLSDGIFAYSVKHETHKHLVKCLICHKEIEVPCPMKQVEAMVENETGFVLTEHNLVMEGVCKECNKRKDKEDVNI